MTLAPSEPAPTAKQSVVLGHDTPSSEAMGGPPGLGLAMTESDVAAPAVDPNDTTALHAIVAATIALVHRRWRVNFSPTVGPPSRAYFAS